MTQEEQSSLIPAPEKESTSVDEVIPFCAMLLSDYKSMPISRDICKNTFRTTYKVRQETNQPQILEVYSTHDNDLIRYIYSSLNRQCL